jgi:hypothetical protein
MRKTCVRRRLPSAVMIGAPVPKSIWASFAGGALHPPERRRRTQHQSPHEAPHAGVSHRGAQLGGEILVEPHR